MNVKSKLEQKRYIRNNSKGFTIIEVLIVLAIAGLIILIVFLAVPALQRTSRNTQRKNDASRLSALINEHVSNNAGVLPDTFGTTPSATELDLSNTSFTIMAPPAATEPDATVLGDLENLVVNTNATCNNNAVTAGGGFRAYTVSYSVETSNGDIPQCL